MSPDGAFIAGSDFLVDGGVTARTVQEMTGSVNSSPWTAR